MASVKPIPAGYHAVTPHLIVRGAAKAIEFYRRAFGAEETVRMPGPDGRLLHAELRIGDSVVMMSDEFPEQGSKSPQSLGGCHGGLFLYLENVEAAWKRAVEAGCEVKMPLADMFWGDRFGKLQDPFGYTWAMATHVEDVTPEEMARRARAAMAAAPAAKT
jgi:uncharacterized glyoxalase superfamily protein PhnB